MHPLLQLAMTQPGLLGEHAQGYAALLGSEVDAFQRDTRKRLLWIALALVCGTAALVLAGVALMLGAALPGMANSAIGVLWAVPCIPLLAALGCWLYLRQGADAPPFAELKQQLQADLQLFKEVSAP